MLIYGGGGHSSVIVEIAKSLNIPVQAIFDDNPEMENDDGTVVIKYSADLFPAEKLIIGIGDNKNRKLVSEKVKHEFMNIIHSTAIIASNAKIGFGNLIIFNSVIEANATIGNHCIINTASSVSHDCSIGNFCHLSPNVALSGGVKVGEGTHIGTGASVIPLVNIGRWVTIGAGAVVINDIPDYAVVVGNPGRIIKYRKEKHEE